MDAADMIHAARQRAGLTQTELAQRSATSQPTLSAYEHGSKVPSATTLARVLSAAGTRLSTAPATRPVRTPGAAGLERAGRRLAEVIELAAALPTRHRPTLDFPRLPAAPQRAR